MQKIILDPKQIYIFEDFYIPNEDHIHLCDRVISLLGNIFDLKTDIKSVIETSYIENLPNTSFDFDFRSIIFLGHENNFETISQEVNATKNSLIFFAGRTLNYKITSKNKFICIDHTNTRELE